MTSKEKSPCEPQLAAFCGEAVSARARGHTFREAMDHLTEEVLNRFLSAAPRLDPARHPSDDDLMSFLRGELPRPEAAAIVRHLLKRCRPCLQLAFSLWMQGPGRPS